MKQTPHYFPDQFGEFTSISVAMRLSSSAIGASVVKNQSQQFRSPARSVALLWVMFVTTPAFAQCPPEVPDRLWRVVPLTQAIVLDLASGANASLNVEDKAAPFPGTLALNDNGTVVGTYLRDDGNGTLIPRPFVWVTATIGSLSPGFYDLLTESGASDDEPGYANDISNGEIVVGGRGDLYNQANLYAYAWDLTAYTGTPGAMDIALDSPSNSSVRWSCAFGIDLAISGTPLIVGGGGQAGCNNTWVAGIFDLSSAPVFDLSPTQPDVYTPVMFPNASSRLIFNTDAAASGYVRDYDAPSGNPYSVCPGSLGSIPCNSDMMAGAFISNTPSLTFLRRDSGAPDPVELQVTTARGLDASGWVVGAVRLPEDGNDCPILPAYWTTPTGLIEYEATPNLPLPSPPPVQVTAECSYPFCSDTKHRVVGWEIGTPFAGRALVWDQCSNNDWCVHYISQLTIDSTEVTFMTTPTTTVGLNTTRYAYETNALGYSVVWVDAGGKVGCVTGGQFAGVVTSIADVDGNFQVDAADFAVLLGAWGSPATSCDLLTVAQNGDVNIDAVDMSIMLGAWGQAPMPWPCSGLGDCEGFAAFAPLDIESMLSAIENLGFESLGAFVTWASNADSESLTAVVNTIRVLSLE